MKKVSMLLLPVFLLGLVTLASAGNRKGDFSVSPMLGGITFDGAQDMENANPIYGARAGYNFTDALGVELLFDYAESNQQSTNARVRMHRYGAELLYHFMPEKKFVPYLAAGYSGVQTNGDATYIDTSNPVGSFGYGVGAKYFVTEDVAWRMDLRHIMYDYKDTYSNYIYTVGLYIPFGNTPPVAKLADPPPPPAEVVKPLAPPAPPAPVAKLAAAPAVVVKGEQSNLTWTSVNATSCDMQPKIGAVNPQGSMPVTPDDTTMYVLTCKGDGGSARSVAGVTVTLPPPPPVAKPSAAAVRFCNKPAILKVYFDTDKYNIKPQYHDELKSVGDFLKEFPKSKGEIAGHTDSTASKEYNQKLSERRAKSIKDYIVKNFGISADRIKAVGYGLTRPVADNKTVEGRAKNRRIEANFNCE